jgi:hypothetical protein
VTADDALCLPLTRLALAYRRQSEAMRNLYDYRYAVHAALGCPDGGPTTCAACAAGAWLEHVERAEVDRRSAVEQHRASAERIAEWRGQLDARRIRATAAIAPGARCRVCSSTSDGSRSCRACGSTTVDATDSVNATLRALAARPAPQTSPERRPGRARSAPRGRRQGSVATGAAGRSGGIAVGGPGGGRAPTPGTDPVGFAAALRSLDRCAGCGQRGTGGKVCEPCSAGV